MSYKNNLKSLKKLFQYKLILTLLIMSFFSNCLPYLFHLGAGQWEIVKNRQSIDEYIQRDSIELNEKEKLQLVGEVRSFAVTNLLLNPEGGYKFFTNLNRSEVGWHVTASYPLKFESYTWWFPIVGKVPYKGYFDLDKAKEEEQSLKKKGLDTKLRITAGYSTLGWFSDPLLSPQLKLKKDELVALVIHEMTHATVYIKNDSLFNESFATFVEEIGTKKYYESLNTKEAKEIIQKREIKKKENYQILSEIKITATELKALYNLEISEDDKLIQKKIIINNFKNKILSLGKKQKSFNQKKWENAELNNENFIGALRYNSGENYFKKLFIECNENFKKFYKEIDKLNNLSKLERGKLLKN